MKIFTGLFHSENYDVSGVLHVDAHVSFTLIINVTLNTNHVAASSSFRLLPPGYMYIYQHHTLTCASTTQHLTARQMNTNEFKQ